MDIILDSNAYLADVSLESINFKNLFDYCRRTKSTIILPRLVREEVVTKYISALQEQAKKSLVSIRELNRLALEPTQRIQLPKIDFQARAHELRRKFRSQHRGVRLRYYADITGVDVHEIYLRGIGRRKPANSNGEELRDVILWLITLQYAKKQNKEIAFVSADKGFWNGDQVHGQILEDLSKHCAKIRIYRTVEDFVKESSPPPKPVDDEQVSPLFDLHSLTDAIVRTASDALLNHRQVFLISFLGIAAMTLTHYEFEEGEIYELGEDNQFMELTYGISLRTDLNFPVPLISQYQGTWANQSPHWEAPVIQSGKGLLPQWPFQPGQLWQDVHNNIVNTTVTPLWRNYAQAMAGVNIIQPWNTIGAGSFAGTASVPYVLVLKARVFLRLTKGVVSEAELESIELMSLTLSADAVTSSGVEDIEPI